MLDIDKIVKWTDMKNITYLNKILHIAQPNILTYLYSLCIDDPLGRVII